MRYLQNVADFSQKPSDDTKRWRTLRRAAQPKPAIKTNPKALPKLSLIDAACIALTADPTCRPWNEPEKSERAAAVYRELEKQKRPRIYPRFPEQVAATAVRQLFEKFNLAFTDYDSEEMMSCGEAAIVLRVILQSERNMRHLIRGALKPRD